MTVIYAHPLSRKLSPPATAIVSIVQLRRSIIGDQASAFLFRDYLHPRYSTYLQTELQLKVVSKTLDGVSLFPPALCASSGLWS